MIIEIKLSDAEIARIADAVLLRLKQHINPSTPADPLLTVNEVAARLRCSVRHVRALISLRRLHATKLTNGGGARVRVKQSEVERLIKQSTP